MEALGLDRLDRGSEPDIFDKFFNDHTIDIRTGELLGRYIAEERDTGRLLRSCYEQLQAAASEMPKKQVAGANGDRLAVLEDKIDAVCAAVDELRQVGVRASGARQLVELEEAGAQPRRDHDRIARRRADRPHGRRREPVQWRVPRRARTARSTRWSTTTRRPRSCSRARTSTSRTGSTSVTSAASNPRRSCSSSATRSCSSPACSTFPMPTVAVDQRARVRDRGDARTRARRACHARGSRLALLPRDRPRAPVPAVHDRAAPGPAHRPDGLGSDPHRPSLHGHRSRRRGHRPRSGRRAGADRPRDRDRDRHVPARVARSPRRSSGTCTPRY